jgi:hypothetical protein
MLLTSGNHDQGRLLDDFCHGNAVATSKLISTFRNIVMPSYSGSSTPRTGLLDPEEECTNILLMVGNSLPVDTG